MTQTLFEPNRPPRDHRIIVHALWASGGCAHQPSIARLIPPAGGDLRSPSAIDVDQLRRYAITRSLFAPTSLMKAIGRLGFLQADPMRAPARAQDLILMHRVRDYRAGELERRYPRLKLDEGFFINYGFFPREILVLLYPRGEPHMCDTWDSKMQARGEEVLAFVRRHGCITAKDVRAHFDHGTMKRWGGNLSITNHLLEGLHYRGFLRVAGREAGTRVYQGLHTAPQEDTPETRVSRAGQLLDILVNLPSDCLISDPARRQQTIA